MFVNRKAAWYLRKARVCSLSDADGLGIQSAPQLAELLLSATQKRLRLAIRGVVVIDQGGELRSLVTQSHELGLLRINGVAQADGYGEIPPPLVFAQCTEHVRVVSVQRISGNVCQLAQGADRHALVAIRGRRRQGSQGQLEPISG